ncbi:hypothetical protein B0H15DRAFT_843000 [Mycena belliarum]|uniref:Uncharacterized protein n=1 Tax=Mycena belliarum TaxID=1033014 RepID=A0AAD6XRB5_9AGAR|nr:hypothetical protein B0H15DRAFT_843000 [Mycena belliae]
MPKTPSKPPTQTPSNPPSTPKKVRPYTVWRSPITAPSTIPLTAPDGPSIKRTEATKKYKLKAADLDTITPISRQPNHMGGSAPIQVYNERDVAALALNLRPGKPLPELASVAGSSSSGPLAHKHGRRIMKTSAMKEFKLSSSQMDQLKPVSMTPNAYGTVTKYYNRCDVENLKSRLEQLRMVGAGNLDGLSHEDAAALRGFI